MREELVCAIYLSLKNDKIMFDANGTHKMSGAMKRQKGLGHSVRYYKHYNFVIMVLHYESYSMVLHFSLVASSDVTEFQPTCRIDNKNITGL